MMSNLDLLNKSRRRVRRVQLLGVKATLEVWRRFTGQSAPEQTVFVAGAQRSGTNMVMSALDRSFQTKVYHEQNRHAFDEYLMRDPEVIQSLRDATRAPVFVIKCLCEMDRLPWLMERFSPARTIWMIRHYDDVINSAIKSFKKLSKGVDNILVDPESEDWRGRGISTDTLSLMRRIYHPEMNDESKIAMFWYMRNQMFFDYGFDSNERVLAIQYERLVSKPDKEFQRMFDFIGIPYSTRVGRFVTARSIRKERAPQVDAKVRDVCNELLDQLQPFTQIPDSRLNRPGIYCG